MSVLGQRGRHVRHTRTALPVALSAALVVALGVVGAGSGSAVAADDCTTPQLADAMVSQGLPTYGRLARGKSTIVKLFLSSPSCLPAGASLAVTGATLSSSTGGLPIELQGTPLPQMGSPATAPVLNSGGDVQFLVPGSYMKPTGTSVSFSVEVRFVLRVPGANPAPGRVTFAQLPGTTTPIGGLVPPEAPPAGVLVVPMGDLSKGAAAQFPDAARTAVQNGMTSLKRVLPVADENGLDYRISAGLLNLGSHTEPSSSGPVTKNYVSNGLFCGSGTQMPYISAQLEAARTAWNSVPGNAKVQRVIGQVWQDVSSGESTTEKNACAEGYAQVPGVASWGRTIASNREGKAMTGTIAAMEYAHTVGSVSDNDPRYTLGHHSKNLQADVTAPGRAYNLLTQEWLADDRSAMQYTALGWHDTNSLLEKEDWDWLQCSVLPPLPSNPVTGKSCDKPGELTYSGAAPSGSGTFVVTGSTDGTAAGTDAHSYTSDDGRLDPSDADSEYRVVQRSGSNGVLRSTPIDVHYATDEHDGEVVHEDLAARGSFGAAVPAEAAATKVELWRGAPDAAGSVLLYRRVRDSAPQFVAAQAGGQSVSVSVTDERPADLRLDLFLRCPGGSTSPLANAVRPTTVGSVAVFVQPYDTSLGCTNAQLVYRVSDGFLATTQADTLTQTAGVTGTAAIYSPSSDATPTAFRVLKLAGTARDALDAPVNDLRWSLTGPSFPTAPQTAAGSTAELLPPKGGYLPGAYTLTLQGYSGSSPVATASRRFTVLADGDGDLLPDPEAQPCFSAGAVADAANALQDSDGDGIANVNDATPCASASTTKVQFNPTSLYKSSSGNNVKVTLYESQVDLTKVAQSEVFLTQFAGFATGTLTGSSTRLPATSWTVIDRTSAVATFDRSAVSGTLSLRPYLLGYIPIFVGTLDGRLRGADPLAPNVFP